MMLRNALLAATILALPAAAIAEPISGLYVGAGVGGDYMLDNNAKLTVGTGTATGKAKSNVIGIAGAASVGYGLGNGLRIELEASGRDIRVKSSGKGAVATGGGTLYTYGPMLNALYDLDLGSSVTPYVGVGGGYQFSQISGGSVSGGGSSFGVKSDTKGSAAVQGILGVAYAIPGATGLAVTGEYRFLATLGDTKFSGSTNTGATGSLKLGNQYHNEILVGLRYAFGATPAAPMMAPTATPAATPAAVAPIRSYLVFFDWDKADLTARAQQIIADAAAASRTVSATKIDVAGHADKTGTAGYNQALSLRRANNVAAELVRLGVPKTAIAITAFGDTKPLVPTAAGVREPQNRRVEIVLH